MRRFKLSAVLGIFTETFGLGRGAAMAAVALIVLTVAAAAYLFLQSAPPKSLVITSGPPGSVFERYALSYSNTLARDHVRVRVVNSRGSEENLARLRLGGSRFDVGFVQGGLTGSVQPEGRRRVLHSLGSIMYEPLWVFCRASNPAVLLSDFAGQRLAIGAPGSGTLSLATLLLATNGIVPGGRTTLLQLDGDEGVTQLLAGRVDTAFLMSDSVSTNTLRSVMRNPEFRVFDFVQAAGYTRRIPYLNRLVIPRGGIDFGMDRPPHDLQLVGPMVELIARGDLHPALSDLLLEAARELHKNPSLLQQKGEFPAPLEHEFTLSPAAIRYFKTGKSWLYRNLPFSVAGVVEGVIALIVPMAIVLIPGLKLIPAVLRWRVKLILFRWYRALQAVERGLHGPANPEAHREWMNRLDHIEATVKSISIPASFADQFYALRGHITYVRERFKEPGPGVVHPK
jgi:hypothetical protein